MPQHRTAITTTSGKKHLTRRSNAVGKPKDLTHHFSDATRARKPSVTKELYKYFFVPGMSNIAGGFPYPGYFPYDVFSADVATPERLLDMGYHGITVSAARSFFRRSDPGTTHMRIPKFEISKPVETRIDIATTLQYGRAPGLPALVSFVREFTFEHMLQGKLGYTRDGADVLLTCGSTDGFSKVIGMLGSHGDTMLVEGFCYPCAIQCTAPFGIGTAPVKMDEGGMMVEGPGGLRDVLENWDDKKGRRPHFMYTVTIGQNPSGITLKRRRRKEIYALCEKFDVIIIEDDPYWHLQFTESSHELPAGAKYPFLAALELSYLTLDTTGRVIRLDTFSKTIAPGCRLGWITAAKPFIAALAMATDLSTQQPSGFAQSMVAHLLCRSWGMDGWVAWIQSLRGVYEERMRAMAAILEAGKELVTASVRRYSFSEEDIELVATKRLYSFLPPDGGMFIWVRINITSHPAYKPFISRGHTKREMMMKLWDWTATTQMTLPSPGGIFAGGEEYRDSADEYFRFCFAAVELEEVKSATERWVKGIKAFWGLHAWEIEKIGEEDSVLGTYKRMEKSGGWGGFRGGKGKLEVAFDHVFV